MAKFMETMDTPMSPQAEIKAETDTLIMTAKGVDVFYGNKQAIDNVSLNIPQNQITARVGEKYVFALSEPHE